MTQPNRRQFLGAAAALAALPDPTAGQSDHPTDVAPRDRLADRGITVSASVLRREVALEIEGPGADLRLTFDPDVAAALSDELAGWSTYILDGSPESTRGRDK